MLYKYPQSEFPYARLVDENRRAGKLKPEFELLDTGIFDEDRYFDVFVEYAKAGPDDILISITAHNRGPEAATLHLLPQLWFRNTWSWSPDRPKPMICADNDGALEARHDQLGVYYLYAEDVSELLFCDNETNAARVFGVPRSAGHWKDAFNEYIVRGDAAAINPARVGTKAGAHYPAVIPAQQSRRIRLRLTSQHDDKPFEKFDALFAGRRNEADHFYQSLTATATTPEARHVQRQAFAGMIWTKQFYYYDIPQWLHGDPGSAAAAGAADFRTQLRLDASHQRRRCFDAG